MGSEVIWAVTPDGWKLPLHYWPGRSPQRRFPMLMVHGLSANRLILDFDERYSLARAARDRGFDVYMLEVRGSGVSQPPDNVQRPDFDWGFSDYSNKDMPAAMAKVLEHSGAKQLHGLGHSMGGMLFYAQAVQRVSFLRSVTTIGSPCVCQLQLGRAEERLLRAATRLAPSGASRRVPLKQFTGTAGRFLAISTRFAGMIINVDNCTPEVLTGLARGGIHDIPSRLLAELANQMDQGCRSEGPYAYEAELDRINVPVQVVSGSVDRIAPASSVAAGAARLRGPDVRYREMGWAHGDRADYGHGDLLVGRNAPEDVFPVVLDFVEEVD